VHLPRFEQILWSNRFKGDVGNQCKVSIDGTDVQVQELGGFAKDFYSHKFKSAGLRYEVGLNIRTGDIVWIHGPFRCGMTDIQISRHAIVNALEEGEMLEADLGYLGEHAKIRTPSALHVRSEEEKAMKSLVRSRHETVNERMKNFEALTGLFRHDLRKHSSIFRAIAVITQLSIETGGPLFMVDYRDIHQ